MAEHYELEEPSLRHRRIEDYIGVNGLHAEDDVSGVTLPSFWFMLTFGFCSIILVNPDEEDLSRSLEFSLGLSFSP